MTESAAQFSLNKKENVQFLRTTMSKAKLQAGWHLRVQITIFEPGSSSFCTVPTLSVILRQALFLNPTFPGLYFSSQPAVSFNRGLFAPIVSKEVLRLSLIVLRSYVQPRVGADISLIQAMCTQRWGEEFLSWKIRLLIFLSRKRLTGFWGGKSNRCSLEKEKERNWLRWEMRSLG